MSAPPPPKKVAFFHAIVKGRVQGVGFRYWTEDAAAEHGVNGWVRNVHGGEVEVEAEGPREKLDEFLRALHRGPILAHVREIDVEWGEREPLYKEFQITF